MVKNIFWILCYVPRQWQNWWECIGDLMQFLFLFLLSWYVHCAGSESPAACEPCATILLVVTMHPHQCPDFSAYIKPHKLYTWTLRAGWLKMVTGRWLKLNSVSLALTKVQATSLSKALETVEAWVVLGERVGPEEWEGGIWAALAISLADQCPSSSRCSPWAAQALIVPWWIVAERLPSPERTWRRWRGCADSELCGSMPSKKKWKAHCFIRTG